MKKNINQLYILILAFLISCDDPAVVNTSYVDNHIIFMCDKALTSCSVNVFNKVSICNLCTSRAKTGFRHFKKRNPNSELIKIKRSDLKIGKTNNNQFSDKEKK